MYIYICTILAYLTDSHLCKASCHTHDGLCGCSHILPFEGLRNMLRHIESELPSMMHLPMSLDSMLHFYRYLSTHVLIQMDSSCYSLMFPYKTEHNSFKYMKFSVYQFHTVACQLSIRLIINIYE